MSKKGSGIRQFLMTLQGKKASLNNIVSFAMFAFVAKKNGVRLLIESEKIDDLSLKISLQILALEEFAKPLLIFNIIPIIDEVYDMSTDDIGNFIDVLYFHNLKQKAISNYGFTLNELGYETKFTNAELKRLDSIKQNGFYTEILDSSGKVRIPFDIKNIDTNISKKISEIVKEKGKSLNEIYHHPIRALHFYVRGSLVRKQSVLAEWYAFLKQTDFTNINNFDELITAINNFEQVPIGGKLFVDDWSEEAGMKTKVLLIKCSVKKIPGETSVIGITRNEFFEDSLVKKNEQKISDVIMKALDDEKIIKKINKCIDIAFVPKRKNLISNIFGWFGRLVGNRLA